MSDKLNLQKMVKSFAKAKKEAEEKVNKAVETVEQTRKDSEAQSNHPS